MLRPSHFATPRAAVGFWFLTLCVLTGSSTVRAQTPAPAPPAAATPPITVVLDGKPIDLGGVAPVQASGRILVPLRPVFEALQAHVTYDPATKAVAADRGDAQLGLVIGSNQATVDGKPEVLDAPAQVINGHTLVPLRFVAESMGAKVAFDPAHGVVTITSPPAYLAPQPQMVEGTLVKVDLAHNPTVTLLADGELRILPLNENVVVLRQVAIAPDATTPPLRQPVRPIDMDGLISGDPVRVTLNPDGQVIQILASSVIIVAKVQFAAHDQIVLDDDRDTTLTIGPNLRYIDPDGKPATTTDLHPGESVGLYISRTSRTVYVVSAYPPDFTLAETSGPAEPLPANALPKPGATQILLVKSDVTAPVKAGDVINVTVRGTAGAKGTFGILPKVHQVPLTEDPDHPGVYAGSYTVQPGDDVLEGRIAAHLIGPDGSSDTQQSDESVTIDTVAPRLLGTFPSPGAQINVSQPNIAIFADDLGGSGLAGATIDLITGPDKTVTRIPCTVAPPSAINTVPPDPLSGLVEVHAVVTDKAGNELPVNFSFFIVTGQSSISGFAHGANRAMAAGEQVPLVMMAQPAGKAYYDVIGSDESVLAHNVPLVEQEPGKYTGTYQIPDNPPDSLRFVGRFVATDGSISQMETTTQVRTVQTPVTLVVLTPKDGDITEGPVTLTGTGGPGDVIDVALRAEGTQFYILEYREEFGTKEFKVNPDGTWTTTPIDLPSRRNVADLRYVFTVTQVDAADEHSEPVVVSVKPR